jgi:transposase-like protein
MGWSADPAKRREWRERLQRFAGSGMTIAAFCDQEGVSGPSFYQWRRKLARERHSAEGTARQGRPARVLESQAFVPVQITQSAVVQMRLPNGVQLSLPASDAALVAAAITAAGGLAAVDREGEAC